MDKNLAREMLLLVNSHDTYQALQKYARERIEGLRMQLDSVQDQMELFRIQGQIKELKRFETLRDEVISSAKK